MTRLQERLSGEQSRLEAVQVEHKTRLKAEIDRADYRERQSTQHLESLELTRQRLAETEERLAELESQGAVREAAPDQSDGGWEGRITERPPSRGEIESHLAAQNEGIRQEREAWEGERQRLEHERQSLSDRLLQQQRELESLREELSAAVAAAGHGSMTVAFSEIEQALPADNLLTQERAAWDADREQLVQRIAALEQELVDQKQFSEGMTLGSEAIAELRSQAQANQRHAEINDLRTELDALHGQLAAALAWQGRYQEVEMSAQQQEKTWNTDREQFERRIADLERQIASAESAAPSAGPDSDLTPAELAAPEPSGGNQLAQLQALYDEQQSAVALERRQLDDQRAFLEAAQEDLTRQHEEFQRSQQEFELRWREREDALRGKEELLNQRAADLVEQLERTSARRAELESDRAQLVEEQAAVERRREPAIVSFPEPMASESAPELCLQSQAPSDVASVELPTQPEPIADGGSLLVIAPTDDMARGESAAEVVSLPDEEPVPPAPMRLSSSTSLSGRHGSVWTQPNRPAVASDDDSIEAYMARLLKRVRGDGSGQPARETFVPPRPAPVADVKPASEPGTSMDQAPVESPKLPRVEQFLPRNRPPELNTSMVAMRELANSAARTAIVRHERRSGGQLALTKAVGALLTLACSGIAAYFAYRTQSLYAGIGAAIGGLAGCYWGGKAALQALKAIKLRVPLENVIRLSNSGSPPPESAEFDSPGDGDADAAVEPDTCGEVPLVGEPATEQPVATDDANAQSAAD